LATHQYSDSKLHSRTNRIPKEIISYNAASDDQCWVSTFILK